MAALGPNGLEVIALSFTEQARWDWLLEHREDSFAIIEQQIPRPTRWFDRATGKWNQSILKSTCLLYGSFMQLRALLTAASIPFEEAPPKRWQKGLHIPARDKDEDKVAWKNRLKSRAQQLFPLSKVTLAVSDSILLAEYCRRKREGLLHVDS